jgi:hypothetical protein
MGGAAADPRPPRDPPRDAADLSVATTSDRPVDAGATSGARPAGGFAASFPTLALFG